MLTTKKNMIKSFQEMFLKSLNDTDENSRAYCAMIKGEIPNTSSTPQTHIASRLLSMRCLDIFKALDRELEIGTHIDGQRNPMSILKHNVCFILLLLWHYDSCS